MPEISIIIPAFNEESRLPRYVDSILDYFAKIGVACEVLIVDDGSTDPTAALVHDYARKNPAIRLVRLPVNRGKGYAVKTGMLQAQGRLLLFADAAAPHP